MMFFIAITSLQTFSQETLNPNTVFFSGIDIAVVIRSFVFFAALNMGTNPNVGAADNVNIAGRDVHIHQHGPD